MYSEGQDMFARKFFFAGPVRLNNVEEDRMVVTCLEGSLVMDLKERTGYLWQIFVSRLRLDIHLIMLLLYDNDVNLKPVKKVKIY